MPPSPTQGPKARALAALAALAVLVLAAIFGGLWTSPPSPVPSSAPAAEFSSARARVHVEAIARAPHRIGSPEHARVRSYVVDQLRAAGLEPEVEEAIVARDKYQPPRFAAVKNVVARLRGTASEKALLLVAHYDSRAMTPGASDDGYGVAALLETARALKITNSAGPPLASDVVFLISDGEEEGLLGAHAFASHHPWAKDVGAVLNFDARGNAGPVMMYQTGEHNGAMVRALARAAPHPAATSLAAAIYRRMPNDSDLSIWLPRMPSLNFANIGGFAHYHAPTDTASRIDEGTLQHHGSYALSLARALAARPLPLPREPDATYFNVGPFFAHYPGALDKPLAFGALLLLLGYVAIGHRRGSVRAPRAAAGFAAALAIATAAAIACALLGLLAGLVHQAAHRTVHTASPALRDLHLAAFCAVAVALALEAQRRAARFLRASELFAGAAALHVLFGVLAATYLPGAAYLFVWPVLLSMPIAIALAHAGALDRDDLPAAAGAIAASCPAIVLVAPMIPLLFTTFELHAAPFVGLVAALLAVSSALAARLLLQASSRRGPLAALALGAACTLAALVYPAASPSYPAPDTLVFAVDGDTGHAFWLSPDRAPDAWTGTVLANATPQAAAPLPYRLGAPVTMGTSPPNPVLAAPAADSKEPGPVIAWLVDGAGEAGRSLRVKVTPPPGAELLSVQVDGVRRARVAGIDTPLTAGTLAFHFFAPPAAGVDIDLVAASVDPMVVHAASQRPGFPAEAKPSPGARPPGLMARPGMMPPWDPLLESDMTLVARSAKSR